MLARGDEGGALHGHEKRVTSAYLLCSCATERAVWCSGAQEGFGMDRELRLRRSRVDVRFASTNVAILENSSIDHD